MTYRLQLGGDTDSAKLLIPTARKVLGELNRDMLFNNLGQLQKTVKLASGAIIKVSNIMGLETVNIMFPEVEPVVPPVVEEEYPLTVNFIVIEVKNPVHDSRYIIWDVGSGTLADAFAEYPITEDDVDGWIASTLAEDATDANAIYSVVLAGESSVNAATSANTGCGVLTNTQEWWLYYGFFDTFGSCGWSDDCCVEPREWYDGEWHGVFETCQECGAGLVWADQFRLSDMKAFILGPLKSYNLTIQVLGSFEGETTCVRNHTYFYDRTFSPGQLEMGNAICQEFPPTTTDMRPCACSELPLYPTSGSTDVCHQLGDRLDCVLKTPVGEFTSLHLYEEEVRTWLFGGYCTMTAFDIEKMWDGVDVPISLTAFSSEVFVQIFGYWGRLKTQDRYNTDWEVMGEVKGAVNEYTSTLNEDPREQEESAAFTNAVDTLITDYIDDNSLDFTSTNEAIDLDIKIYEVPEENA